MAFQVEGCRRDALQRESCWVRLFADARRSFRAVAVVAAIGQIMVIGIDRSRSDFVTSIYDRPGLRESTQGTAQHRPRSADQAQRLSTEVKTFIGPELTAPPSKDAATPGRRANPGAATTSLHRLRADVGNEGLLRPERDALLDTYVGGESTNANHAN